MLHEKFQWRSRSTIRVAFFYVFTKFLISLARARSRLENDFELVVNEEIVAPPAIVAFFTVSFL